MNLFSFYPLTIVFQFNSNILNSQIEIFKKLYNEIPDLINKENENDESSSKYYRDYFNVNLSKKLGFYQKIYIQKNHYMERIFAY